MKKAICLFGILCLLAGCKPAKSSGPNEPDPAAGAVACTINGHHCWDVVQALAQTETIYPSGKNTCYNYPDPTNLCTYKNPALQERGMAVTFLDMYRDGGSRIYYLSDGKNEVHVFINQRFGSPERGYSTLSWSDKRSVTFDEKGRIVHQEPAADCVVAWMNCEDVARKINEFFAARDRMTHDPERPDAPDGSFVGRVCRNEKCYYSQHDSEFRWLRLPPDSRREENGIYFYQLPDGQKMIFNWQASGAEKGILTVIKKDGSERKFNSEGQRIENK